MNIINKILIANRGEIAVRIIKTARKLGIKTVAIYAEIDKDALHVSFADESHCIGEAELSDTYLNIEKIIGIAKKSNCDAIHPGYGFMAENSRFVDACNDAGIIFIGPNTHSMKVMGNKIEAREFVSKFNIPMTKGVTGDKQTLLKASKDIPFPLLLKAAAGGGGKGMRIVNSEAELEEAIEATSREAKAYFGDEAVYIEQFIRNPRHIEVQILGDNFGNVIHLFERECSIQRRYQKIIEESPSPTLTPELRLKMGEAAVRIGKEINYNNAGTIEFLVDESLNFYFLEMNTRIQVEHPITEMVTGIDIVEEQIHIAAGNTLRLKQEDIKQNGHAIECRIYAEDPSNNFLPSPGKMLLFKEPVIADIRIDTGITKHTEIKSAFDPMICKLVVWSPSREEATKKMLTALYEFVIHGIKTNITYLIALLQDEAFIKNKISTKFCDEFTPQIIEKLNLEKSKIPAHIPLIAYTLYSLNNKSIQERTHFTDEHNVWNTIGYWRDLMEIRISLSETEYPVIIESIKNNEYQIQFNGASYNTSLKIIEDHKIEFFINDIFYSAFISEDLKSNAFLSYSGFIFNLIRKDILHKDTATFRIEDYIEVSNNINSPMPGKVIKVNVNVGDEVKKGDVLLIIEAMKMENRIICSKDKAIVESVNVKAGQMVDTITALIVFKD
ncbi:MAG: acetyl-CoA carboxylase biotin carboxylase subunit [Bacteroidetes bacterium]|nr:acetyl-CoA carboxylase biotin carboxylase subunit [Bacteroidota bacterium]